jgi:hypothetical protein
MKREMRDPNKKPCKRVRPLVGYQTLLTPLGNDTVKNEYELMFLG